MKPPLPDVYRWEGKPSIWTALKMPAKEYAAAGWKPTSGLFALTGAGQVYRFKGSPGSWELLGSPAGSEAGHLYGGPDGLFVTHAKKGNVYQWQGKPNAWKDISTTLGVPFEMLAVGKSSDPEFKTQVYGLAGASAPARVRGVYQWTGKWYNRGGEAAAIFASGTRLFATNPKSGDLMSPYPTGWKKVGAAGKMFAPDGKGGIVSLSPTTASVANQGVFVWKGTPNAWEKIGSVAGKVFAGGDHVFATDVKTKDLMRYVPPGKVVTGPNGLLIVAPQKFHAALGDYVKHKQAQLPTTLVSLEQALKTAGVDDAERLKKYLFQEWKTKKIRYVLLVGEADALPVRYMVLDRADPKAFDYAFYPSDLYYADLAKKDGSFEDWNARKDGPHAQYFGEVRGEKNKGDPINFDNVHYIPEVAVGRWPVRTATEVQQVANKTMAYEKAVAARTIPGLSNAALFALSPDLGDSRPSFDGIASKLVAAGWKVEKRYFKDTSPKYNTLPPTEAQLHALLNSGMGVVMHNGHGSPTGWDQCFEQANLAKVKNADRLPIMISSGCDTAQFSPLAPYSAYTDRTGVDHKGTIAGEVFKSPPPAPAVYQKKFTTPSLGKHLVRGGANGAVAYIGINTGGQPCAQTLVEGFGLAVAKSGNRRLGDCWNEAVQYYWDKEKLATLVPTKSWYPPAVFFQGMKFMVYGDPSLVLPKK